MEHPQMQMTPVQERIQQDVKVLIGELNLQIIMLRSELTEAHNRLQQQAEAAAKVNGSRHPTQHEERTPQRL